MSIKVMSRVFQSSRAKLSDRLVLLSIADNADDSGRAWPSVRVIAAKAGVSERQAQLSIRSLSELGELTVEYNGGWRKTNLYLVKV